MIYIDGSQKSGSGTIVRFAVGLAALLGEELRLINIRAKREKPGLRPQHLKAIEALAQICHGTVDGAEVGASEIRFKPGGKVKGGHFEWDIGTAGSTTLLAMTLLPAACFAREAASFRISGGLFQDFAPSAYHMQFVLFPTLAKMGINAEISIVRPGYVPRGGGIIEVGLKPVTGKAKPIRLARQGDVTAIEGIALSSHLKERKVSERMVEKCNEVLGAKGYQAQIKIIHDIQAPHPTPACGLLISNDNSSFGGSLFLK